ncbi:hypothetical protein EDB89DRAFT_921973 [Lactarius sanguifluus]|nr:hypothetical protein EDB89DRAFT_921973 [Lactarius sanguifluus]
MKECLPKLVCNSTNSTAFLQQSSPNLTPNYMQLSAYYSQQSVILLAQISAQLAVSGSPPPATIFLSTPFPGFHVTPLDVGVNMFCLMSLVFSLTTVLATTISSGFATTCMSSRSKTTFLAFPDATVPLQRCGKVVHAGGIQCSPALTYLHLFLPVPHWTRGLSLQCKHCHGDHYGDYDRPLRCAVSLVHHRPCL